MSLPFRITTRTGNRYRTAHGLTSCRRALAIDAYDRLGNQTIIYVADIKKHSAGKLSQPASDPKSDRQLPVESCGYCGHVGPAVDLTDHWPFCANCGGI